MTYADEIDENKIGWFFSVPTVYMCKRDRFTDIACNAYFIVEPTTDFVTCWVSRPMVS